MEKKVAIDSPDLMNFPMTVLVCSNVNMSHAFAIEIDECGILQLTCQSSNAACLPACHPMRAQVSSSVIVSRKHVSRISSFFLTYFMEQAN
jgi:hypothetical protein